MMRVLNQLIVLLCIGRCFGAAPAFAEGGVKVGVLLPLTGEGSSAYGEPARQAAFLAKSKRPATPIDLVVEDSACNGRVAVTAAHKLVSNDKVSAIIGDSCWADLIAAVTEPAHVVVVATGSAQSSVRDAGDFVFRLKLDVKIDSRAIARELVQKLNFRRAAVLYVQDQWGEGINSNFSDEFEKMGGKIVAPLGFIDGTTDFKAILLKTKLNPPDVLMLAGYSAQIGLIARQARELGIKTQLAAYRGSLGDETLKLAGGAAEGMLFMEEFDPEMNLEPTKSFVRDFTVKYGATPNLFAAMGYDAFNLLADAVEKCASNTACIRDFLYSVKDYPGVSGRLTFDDHGDVTKALTLKQIKDGKFVSYKP